MPKEPKKNMSTSIGHATRHAPLGQVLVDDANRGKYATRKSGVAGGRGRADVREEADLLDEATSRKILELSREQQRELQEEEAARRRQREPGRTTHVPRQSRARRGAEYSSDDDESKAADVEEEDEILVEHDQGYVVVADEIGLTPGEEALLSSIMGAGDGGDGEPERRNLADIIMAKIEEKEARAQAGGEPPDGRSEGDSEMELPPKVVQVYTEIGKILTHYTSGKLPKAFKVIPSLHNWEEVLYLTRPDLWTPQAMYAATRIFASNLNPKMAQRFYNLVLLDAIRADVHANKKMNYHYYAALKKSVYKPAAFFRGILLPLCREGCTLREAVLVASVLQKVSVPVHHSAVALHKLAGMAAYNGAASIFIKTLLNKKYSLPAPVIDSLIQHFVRFKEDEDAELPVLWHQALLVFVQRYKNEVGTAGKAQLRDLMKVHSHPKITLEVRRELFGGAAWREERGEAAGDAMMVM